MLLSSPQFDPKMHEKQMSEFKAQKAELDKSLAEWRKGQDIKQLEAQALKALENAKAEAASIVANAKKGVAQVEKSRKEFDAMKQELSVSIEKAKKDKEAAAKALADAEKERADAINTKGVLCREMEECCKERKYLQDQLIKLKKLLSDFNASIA